MTHNETRIQRYREEAIAALRSVSGEDDIDSFNQAIAAINNLLPYLNLRSTEYPIR